MLKLSASRTLDIGSGDFKLFASVMYSISDTAMVNVHLACPYEKRILQFFHQALAPPEELRLMGQDGEYVPVHPQLASTLLSLVLETSSVIAPEAPIAAMQQLAQLLHFGR